jgi:hypothetical protein
MPPNTRTRTPQRPTTVPAAARSLAFQVGLDDATRLNLAVLLAAGEEFELNGRFASRVRFAYEALPPSTSGRSSAVARRAEEQRILTSTLKPIRYVEGREFNLAAPLDPYFLLEIFGPRQLHEALDLYPLAKLKGGADIVIARHPGTKPTNRSSKEAVMAYIERYVIGGESPSR